jgi:hypothetical protein
MKLQEVWFKTLKLLIKKINTIDNVSHITLKKINEILYLKADDIKYGKINEEQKEIIIFLKKQLIEGGDKIYLKKQWQSLEKTSIEENIFILNTITSKKDFDIFYQKIVSNIEDITLNSRNKSKEKREKIIHFFWLFIWILELYDEKSIYIDILSKNIWRIKKYA